MPDVYRDAEWSNVRHPAVREWSLGLTGRVGGVAAGTTNWGLLGHGLLILGPTGTGKSSAAALCCRASVEAGLTTRWTYVPDLVDRLSAGPKERLHEVAMQSAVNVLVWDDWGVRDLADWEIGYLDQIVEARYRSRKPMVVTTNWTPEDLRTDRRMARLVDRWRERTASQAVILSGESMRNR